MLRDLRMGFIPTLWPGARLDQSVAGYTGVNATTMFSPDAPIECVKQDLLGRASFASALTKAIFSTSGPDSFVVGIHGKWGTGKSSVLNLLVEQIGELNESAKSDEEKLHILRFNPWNFSDQNQLVFQFLKQFRAHLLKFQAKGKKTVERLVDALDDYAEALAPPLELIPHGGKLLSYGVKFGVRGARKLLGSAKEIGDIFAQLAAQSTSLRLRTVVLIDDIDRLNAAETRQIFQLVKLTARLPYVTYVLAFDRAAVANALKELGIESGEEYLEKIVQVSFELPAIAEATLSSFLTQGLDALLAKYKPAHFDTHRFGNLFHSGFRDCFGSVRHVRRFLNGLEFSLGLIGHELNGVDVIGIEALKTFYPRTFEAVRSNKELFAGHVDSMTKDLGAPEYRKKVDAVLLANDELDDDLKSLLTELFPKVEYAYSLSHTIYSHHSETEWEKTYRVATARYFDAYFQLTLAPSEVSVVEISQLIGESGDERACIAHLRQLASEGRLKGAMDSLRFRLKEVPPMNLSTLLGALIQIGDLASDSGAVFAGQIPEYWHVRWVVFDVLELLPQSSRPLTLLNIAQTAFAPKTVINVVALIEEQRQKESKYPEFGNDELRSIRQAVAKRIRTAIESNEISDPPEALPLILSVLRQWGDPNDATSYVQKLTDTDGQLARFLDKFTYQTHSTALTDKVMRSHNEVAMKQLADALDLDALVRRISRIDLNKVRNEDKEVLTFVSQQIDKMRQQGFTPEQFDNRRFLDE